MIKKATVLALIVTAGMELLLNVPLILFVLKEPAGRIVEKMPLLSIQFVVFFLLNFAVWSFVFAIRRQS